MADRSRGRAALTRRIDDDAWFIRIGRATTADEVRAQTTGLAAQLIAGHAGQAIPGDRTELLDAGATVVVRKAGRQNLLNTCADHAPERP